MANYHEYVRSDTGRLKDNVSKQDVNDLLDKYETTFDMDIDTNNDGEAHTVILYGNGFTAWTGDNEDGYPDDPATEQFLQELAELIAGQFKIKVVGHEKLRHVDGYCYRIDDGAVYFTNLDSAGKRVETDE